MEAYLRRFILFFTNPHCYDEYFIKFNFFDGDCFKTSLSKTLGAIIILGSVTVKVPQILKIIKSKSVGGINLYGVLLDLFAITSGFAYAYVKRFSFSAWGEVFFLAIQTSLIAILILHYTKRDLQAVIFVVSYLFFVYLFITERVPLDVLWSLQILNLPVVIVGKTPCPLVRVVSGALAVGILSFCSPSVGLQALSNFKNKSTGQLSFITCWMQFAGTTVRIFTSIQETGDMTFILSYVICSILNGIVAFQFLFYNGETVKPDNKKLK